MQFQGSKFKVQVFRTLHPTKESYYEYAFVKNA
jgi:hypothetical protein